MKEEKCFFRIGKSKVIVEAQILFKDIMIDEQIHFESGFRKHLLESGIFCYVPHMAQMHREIWTEEQLLVFYFSKDTMGDKFRRTGKRGKLIFEPVEFMHQIPQRFYQIVNILGHEYPLPKEAIPDYYFIDPKHFKRIIDLLIFS